MTFVLECIIACGLFTIVIKTASSGRREAFENDYPPVVTARLREMGALANRPPTKRADIVRKAVAFMVFSALVAVALRHVNGIHTFVEAAYTAYALWFVVDWYDFLVVDILLAPFDAFYRMAGVNAFDRSAVQFHARASLRGMVIGLPFALFVGLLVALI